MLWYRPSFLLTSVVIANASDFSFIQSGPTALHNPVVGFAAEQRETHPSPPGDLSLLSTDRFAVLEHPLFPDYHVRIKKSEFCDGTVGTYTGYIDIQARHLFFYFFESRSDPAKDDVIFWTSGGPGCSSSLSLFMELGPCRVTSPDNTTFNPHSCNEHANVFFVDQPIGVGFSYSEYGETVNTTPDAAKDIAAFIAIFLEHFSQFGGRAFHMAGSSYGGRYIPAFAAEVYGQNAKLIEAGLMPVNLSSIMLGNGCTDWISMVPSWYDMACTPASVAPILDISSCVRMKQAVPRCKDALQKSCIDSYDSLSCGAADMFCQTELSGPLLITDYNIYDISKRCERSLALCYPITEKITSYLDRPDVREQIGVDALVSANFTLCNDDVHAAFSATQDLMFPTRHYVSALLERGVRALVYVGINDWACNWVGNERMLLDLEWTGQDAFVKTPLREWTVNGNVAGLTRRSGALTFATMYGAGHMAPYDKPAESLELTKRWLAGEEL